MTLIELLIAMLITSIVLVASYGMLDQLKRTSESEYRNTALHPAELRHDLSTWLGSTRTNFEGYTYPFVGTAHPDAQVQTLVAAARPYVERVSLAEISIDRDSATVDRGLTITLSDPIEPRRQTFELDASVSSMKIRYLTMKDLDAGARVWLEEYTSTVQPPDAIEVALHALPGEALPPLLQLPILVASVGQ